MARRAHSQPLCRCAPPIPPPTDRLHVARRASAWPPSCRAHDPIGGIGRVGRSEEGSTPRTVSVTSRFPLLQEPMKTLTPCRPADGAAEVTRPPRRGSRGAVPRRRRSPSTPPCRSRSPRTRATRTPSDAPPADDAPSASTRHQRRPRRSQSTLPRRVTFRRGNVGVARCPPRRLLTSSEWQGGLRRYVVPLVLNRSTRRSSGEEGVLGQPQRRRRDGVPCHAMTLGWRPQRTRAFAVAALEE